MGNQKPHIEGQTVQSLKQKSQNNKQYTNSHILNTPYRTDRELFG
jgi:hypothetical protein